MPVEDAKERRERIRNSMRQFYNLPNDNPSPTSGNTTPSASSAREDAFRRANLKTTAPASAALDMDSPSFDASTYAADLLQNASIRGLYERDTSLNREIRALDGSLQELVYKNYSKFIHATDTIRQMRDNVADIDTKLDALSHNVNSIAGVSKTISGNLESHRSKIEEMLTRNQMLHKIKFLIELPVTMKLAIKEGRYADAVRDWQAGDLVFTRHSKVASFQRTHEECRAIALQLFKQLEVTVKKGSLFVNPDDGDQPAAVDAIAQQHHHHDGKEKSAAATTTTIQPLPIVPSSNAAHSTTTNPYSVGNASIMIQQALGDLTVLVNTTIFTDANRPKSFATKIVNTLYDSVEESLKTKLRRITDDISRDWCTPFTTSGISTDVWPAGTDCIFTAAGTTTTSSPTTTTSSSSGGAAVLVYEHITTPFTNSPAALENHFEHIKKAFAKAVADIELIEECDQEQNAQHASHHHSNSEDANDAATQKHRITAACQPALVTFMDTIFPLVAKVSASYLKALVHHQSNVMDSQRSAAEAAIAVKRSCEGCVQTLTKIITQFVELLKRIGIKYLQSPRGFASLVDDCTALVFEHIGNALHGYVHFCPIRGTIVKPKGGGAAATPSATPPVKAAPSDATFVHAHSVLVAAMQLSLMVDRNFGSLVRSPVPVAEGGGGHAPKDNLKALTLNYRSSANKLISHFICLAGNHFGNMLKENYVLHRLRSSRTPQESPSGPHNDITITFAQWAALHAAARHWFGASTDGVEMSSSTATSMDIQPTASSANFSSHGRSDSEAGSSRLPSATRIGQQLPTVATIPGAPGSEANATRLKLGTKALHLLDDFIANSNAAPQPHNPQMGSSNSAANLSDAGLNDEDSLHVWDALHIQDSVICFSLVALLETLRSLQICGDRNEKDGTSSGSLPFPLHFVQQLQIDLSFLLQQINPNLMFWIQEEVRLVVIINELMAAAVHGCGGQKDAMFGGAMVEKLARSDM